MTVAALFAGLAVLVLLSRPPLPARLIATVRQPRRAASASTSRRAAVALAAVATAATVGGLPGAGLGVVVAVALSRWMASLPSRAALERERALRADLPLAAELLAACLAAGATPAAALRAVAAAVGGALGGVLATAARRWAMTGSLAAAFAGLPECAAGAPVHALAVVFSRAERGGASAVPLLQSAARELRDARRTDLEAAARRAGAFAVVPLGLCFLPAFVLVGIVPLVAGLLRQVVP